MTPTGPERIGLRSLIASPEVTLIPGVTDCVVANLAVQAGFEAVYVSGNMLAASLGMPDIGLVTADEVANRAGAIARSVDVPVVCDADTGYGDAMNVIRTVEMFERQGVEAIHLEDQVSPKRCGHVAGKELIDIADMVAKVRAATSARLTSEFVVIARTDARSVMGLSETVRRATAYAEAGADVLFPESLESETEFEVVARELAGVPLMANMTDFGRTPLIRGEVFAELGVAVVIYPGAITRAMWWAARESLKALCANKTQVGWQDRMLDRNEMDVLTRAALWRERHELVRLVDARATGRLRN